MTPPQATILKIILSQDCNVIYGNHPYFYLIFRLWNQGRHRKWAVPFAACQIKEYLFLSYFCYFEPWEIRETQAGFQFLEQTFLTKRKISLFIWSSAHNNLIFPLKLLSIRAFYFYPMTSEAKEAIGGRLLISFKCWPIHLVNEVSYKV